MYRQNEVSIEYNQISVVLLIEFRHRIHTYSGSVLSKETPLFRASSIDGELLLIEFCASHIRLSWQLRKKWWYFELRKQAWVLTERNFVIKMIYSCGRHVCECLFWFGFLAWLSLRDDMTQYEEGNIINLANKDAALFSRNWHTVS